MSYNFCKTYVLRIYSFGLTEGVVPDRLAYEDSREITSVSS